MTKQRYYFHFLAGTPYFKDMRFFVVEPKDVARFHLFYFAMSLWILTILPAVVVLRNMGLGDKLLAMIPACGRVLTTMVLLVRYKTLKQGKPEQADQYTPSLFFNIFAFLFFNLGAFLFAYGFSAYSLLPNRVGYFLAVVTSAISLIPLVTYICQIKHTR